MRRERHKLKPDYLAGSENTVGISAPPHCR
jgi:hypothetical protein